MLVKVPMMVVKERGEEIKDESGREGRRKMTKEKREGKGKGEKETGREQRREGDNRRVGKGD